MPDAFGHWCEDGEDFTVPARPTGLFGGETYEVEDLLLDGNGIGGCSPSTRRGRASRSSTC